MLPLPQSGIARSVKRHNGDASVLCDWIEASALLDNEEISRSDIVDLLLEGQYYEDQDFAEEWLGTDVWSQLGLRMRWLGSAAPLVIRGNTVEPNPGIPENASHRFLLLVSLTSAYSDWTKTFGPDYTRQGELFERLVTEAVTVMFQGWTVVRTGWGGTQTRSFAETVQELANGIGVSVGDVEQWSGDREKESGLDLVWHRPFGDTRGGNPIYLAQCASGRDWVHKLDTPNLSRWMRILIFPQRPGKAFAIPFTLAPDDLRRRSNDNDLVLLDRYRLLYAGALSPEWESEALRRDIDDWIKPRLDWLRTAFV